MVRSCLTRLRWLALLCMTVGGSRIAAAKPPPAAPSGLVATTIASNRIDLAWVDNANTEDGFKIERAPDNSGSPGTWSQITNVGQNVVAYSDMGVVADFRYWYRVRAFNSGGDSAYTTATSATTPPLAPLNLSATAAGS